METIQLIRALLGSMDSEYIQQNDDKIIDLLEQAANTLERFSSENKQLHNDLMMQTMLAQSRLNVIESDGQYAKKFKALLRDFKELILSPDSVCEYCKYNQPCRGKECDLYIEGKEAWDHNGCKHDWEWNCIDFNFGECSKLENTPCNGCIKNKMQGFEWRGVNND